MNVRRAAGAAAVVGASRADLGQAKRAPSPLGEPGERARETYQPLRPPPLAEASVRSAQSIRGIAVKGASELRPKIGEARVIVAGTPAGATGASGRARMLMAAGELG
jgi:hypothetical protein